VKVFLIATLTVAAVTASIILPADFASAAMYPDDGVSVKFTAPNTVPAFEPQVGRGSPLLAGVAQQIALGPAAATAHSALVRVSVFTPASSLDVSLAGSPALHSEAGESASTTVLVPVSAGTVALASTADANARLEVLALFSGDTTAPGSTVAIAAPVTRADTRADFGETTVGITGLGGVPSEHVRAAYITVIAEAASPSSLVVDGQSIALSTGTTTVSTIVTPSASGDIAIDYPASAVDVRIDVRGYVADAADGAGALNGPGSYWSTPDYAPETYAVASGATTSLDLPTVSSDGYVLALISATPTDALTVIHAGAALNGRGTGAIADPVAGTQQQLALIPTASSQLSIRRGQTEVTVLPLGAILGSDGGSSDGPQIAISSPTATALDVTETITFDFEGTFETPGSAPLRIEVRLDGNTYSTASITTGESESTWHFTGAVPDSGVYDLEFRLVDRDGGQASAHWSGSVLMPGPSDAVVNSRAFQIGTPGHVASIIALDEYSVTFDADPGVIPGDVMTSLVAANAPQGFMRTVLAVDIAHGTWLVTTGYATLEDVFLQLDIDYVINPSMPSQDDIEAVPDSFDPEGFLQQSSIEVLPIDQLDLDPYLGEEQTPEGTQIPDFEPATASMPSSAAKPGFAADHIVLSNTFEPSWGWKAEGIFTSGVNAVHSSGDGGSVEIKSTFKYSGSVTVGLRLAIKIEADVSIIPFELKVEMTKFLNSTITVEKHSTDTKFAISAAWTKRFTQEVLKKYFLPVITIPTPVPILIFPSIAIDLVAKLKFTGEVAFETSEGSRSETERGSYYNRGVTTPISSGPITTPKPFDVSGVSFSGKAEASGGLSLNFNFLIYEASGPRILLEAMEGLGFEAKVAAVASPDTSLQLKYYVFIDVSVKLQFVIAVPFTRIDLVNITLIDGALRFELNAGVLRMDAAFPDGEYGPDDGTPTPPVSDPIPDDPSPALCEGYSSGSTTYVCTRDEFLAAISNPSVTTIALLRGIDRWSGATSNPDTEGCSPASGVPASNSITIPRSMVLDPQSHMLCLYGIRLAPGVVLTVNDHAWAADGNIISVAVPSSGAPGIDLTGGRLDVFAGRLSGIGAGSSAGISTAAGVLAIHGGYVYGQGAGGGAGIGGSSHTTAGQLVMTGGSAYGEGSLAGASNADGGAGVGGGYRGSGGLISVFGGSLSGTGGDGGAGIGGGAFGSAGSITQSGGTIAGYGGGNSTDTAFLGGSGVGGGYNGAGGYILVNDGALAGYGENGSAGIGGGARGYGGTLTIKGGTVNGYSDSGDGEFSGAGIGGGYLASGGSISVRGGNVSGFCQYGAGAGIGGGGGGDGATLTVTGGAVRGFGGSHGGAGIGGGNNGGDSGLITVSDASMSGYGEAGGAGIGGGDGGNAAPLSFTNSNVFAYSSDGAAGIGGGEGGSAGRITVSGGSVETYSSTGGGGAGIGGGRGGSVGDISLTDATVLAYGYGGGAGIGGGSGGSNGEITITNSAVTANAFDFADGGGAGIGSGGGQDSGAITIESSTVIAQASAGGAGIGSGFGGAVENIVIADSDLTVNVNDDGEIGLIGGAGIGSGGYGTAGTITIDGNSARIYTADGAAAVGSGAHGSVQSISIANLAADYLVGSSGGVGIGAGAYGIGAQVAITESALSVYSGNGGAGIGSGLGGSIDAIVITDTALLQVVGGGGGAGIGSGRDGSVGVITISGGSLFATSDGGGAGIGGGSSSSGAGISLTDVTVEVHVSGTTDGRNGAGIGGGYLGSGGTITITGGSLNVTSFSGGAGIGGGGEGDGGTISLSLLSASTVVGGDGAAGIGGGSGGSGGTVTISSSDLSVQALGGIPIVVPDPDPVDPIEPEEPAEPAFGGTGAAIGGGDTGDGGSVVIDSSSTLTVSADPAQSVIGGGTGSSVFGTLELAGALQLNDATLVLPADVEITLTGSITGVLTGDPLDELAETPAAITGAGTIHNSGAISATIDPLVTVTGTVFAVTFEPNNVDALDPATTVTVYATTFTLGRRHLAVPPVLPGWVFVDWNTAADGSGTVLDASSVLSGSLTVYAIWQTE
jgi:hypothetical protein